MCGEHGRTSKGHREDIVRTNGRVIDNRQQTRLRIHGQSCAFTDKRQGKRWGRQSTPHERLPLTLGKGRVTHPCWGLGPVSLCGGSTAKMERGTQRTKLGVCHTLGAGARCVRVVGVSRGHAAHRSVRLSPEETCARSGGWGQCGGDRGRAGQWWRRGGEP